MIRINDENKDNSKYILLIPSMLDAHFPLLKYAFYSKNYHPVILENEDNITNTGLKYVNNDMCYPSILNVGQMVAALQSGRYDTDRVRLLMPSAGDACRGSNYFGVVKKAVKKAGFDNVKVLSLNMKGLEKGECMKLNPFMVWRALFGLFYGDIIMLLVNQLRPYEKEKGAVEKCQQKWFGILGNDLKQFRNLSFRRMRKNFSRIAKDFSDIPVIDEKKRRIGLVGELYIKYCHIGNWNMIKYIEAQGAESHTNGLSWYAIYYLDSHLWDEKGIMGLGYRIVKNIFERLQNDMIVTLKEYGFYTLENFSTLKKEAKGYVSYDCMVGDGWLIGAEVVGHIKHDCQKVLAMQPFGCMPNQVCGRGLYPSLQRKLKEGQIMTIDTDSSGSPSNVFNRVELLLR